MLRNNWEVSNKRFVVMFDIMGFKDFVARNDAKTVYKRMVKLTDIKENIPIIALKNDSDALEQFYSVTFSDSFFLFSKNDSVKNLENILYISRGIMATAIMAKIPINGSVAYGEISVDKGKQIYCGQPIIDAYQLQQDVHYYGVVFHCSVDKFISEQCSQNENVFHSYFRAKTYLKSGLITHNNLDWFISETLGENGKRFKNEELETFMESVSGAPRKYIDNTIEMKKACRKLFQVND